MEDMIDGPNDATPLNHFWGNLFHIDYDSMKPPKPGTTRQTHKFGAPKFDAKINLYSDGSVTKNNAAAGLYICGGLDKQSYNLGPNVTIWQAETYGVKKCAQWL